MALDITHQYLEVTEVAAVVITESVLDTVVGDYVRDIRIMDADGNIQVQLRLHSITKDNLNITAPVQMF